VSLGAKGCALTALLAASSLIAQEQLLERELELHAGELSCKASPSGKILDLTFRGRLAIKELSLYGKDESKLGRMLQGEAPATAKAFVKKLGDGSYAIRVEGVLSRGKKELKSAKYEESIAITPSGLELDCEIETLAQMSSRMDIFMAAASCPVESYAGRGYVFERNGRAPELWIVPASYSKDSDIHAFGRKASFSLNGFVAELSSPNSLLLGDERSWKGKFLRFEAMQGIAWSHNPTVYSPGSKFKFSLKVQFIPD